MLQVRKRATCNGPPVSPFRPCCACFHPVVVAFCTLSAALQHVEAAGQETYGYG